MPKAVVRSLIILPLVLALATPARAQQTIQLHDAGNVAAFGYYVGAYHGLDLTSAPGGPLIDLFCVDFLHHVKVGQTWSAYITSLAWNLDGLTRGGNAKLTDYRKAAWLTTRFALNPTTSWGQIHATIWQLITPGAAGEPTPSSSYWLDLANTHYLDNGVGFYDGFALVTPTNMSDPSSTQEFLTRTTITPEPSEIVLFASGLLGLGFMVVRRRRARIV